MKIVITAEGPSLDSTIDPRFGRAKNFILFDTDTNQHRVIDNQQNRDMAQGAGIQSAKQVFSLGAELVITGQCGPKALQVLQAAKIQIVLGAQGTVAQSIDRFKMGELRPEKSNNFLETRE